LKLPSFIFFNELSVFNCDSLKVYVQLYTGAASVLQTQGHL